MQPKQSDRRQFLKGGAALAGLAAGSILPESVKASVATSPSNIPIPGVEISEDVKDYKPYGDRSPFETSGRLDDMPMSGPRKAMDMKVMPAKKLTPLQDLSGSTTPGPLHYVANHSIPPNIDPKEYRLLIYGMVDHPTVFSLEDLKRLPAVNAVHFLECLMNSKWIYHGNGVESNESVQDLHGMTSCSE